MNKLFIGLILISTLFLMSLNAADIKIVVKKQEGTLKLYKYKKPMSVELVRSKEQLKKYLETSINTTISIFPSNEIKDLNIDFTTHHVLVLFKYKRFNWMPKANFSVDDEKILNIRLDSNNGKRHLTANSNIPFYQFSIITVKKDAYDVIRVFDKEFVLEDY